MSIDVVRSANYSPLFTCCSSSKLTCAIKLCIRSPLLSLQSRYMIPMTFLASKHVSLLRLGIWSSSDLTLGSLRGVTLNTNSQAKWNKITALAANLNKWLTLPASRPVHPRRTSPIGKEYYPRLFYFGLLFEHRSVSLQYSLCPEFVQQREKQSRVPSSDLTSNGAKKR